MMKRKAFTLIELLVVIVIIAALLALLLPAVGMVRDSALTVDCINRKRQIFLQLANYTNDNDGMFPYGLPGPAFNTPWYRTISEETQASGASRIYFCSTDRRSVSSAYASLAVSIGFNQQGLGGDSGGIAGGTSDYVGIPAQMQRLGKPTATLIATESSYPYFPTSWRIDANGVMKVYPAHRNGRTLVILLADGHAEAIHGNGAYDTNAFYQPTALGKNDGSVPFANLDTMWDRK
jgi:prepilin-type N-terminal cleavage/methylation domain-containing protein